MSTSSWLSRTQGENHLLCPLFARFNCIFIRCINICVFYLLRARNDDLVERMNGKMKKTEDTVETVSSKMKVLEGEQEKITSTIGGDRCIILFKCIQMRLEKLVPALMFSLTREICFSSMGSTW